MSFSSNLQTGRGLNNFLLFRVRNFLARFELYKRPTPRRRYTYIIHNILYRYTRGTCTSVKPFGKRRALRVIDLPLNLLYRYRIYVCIRMWYMIRGTVNHPDPDSARRPPVRQPRKNDTPNRARSVSLLYCSFRLFVLIYDNSS